MTLSARVLLASLALSAALASAGVPDVSAAALSKSRYISLWTSACTAGGESSKLKISPGEAAYMMVVRPFLEVFGPVLVGPGVKQPPLSQMVRETCSCMARYIASRKTNLSAPTSDAMAQAAWDNCMARAFP